jgi:hypothetical protein
MAATSYITQQTPKVFDAIETTTPDNAEALMEVFSPDARF